VIEVYFGGGDEGTGFVLEVFYKGGKGVFIEFKVKPFNDACVLNLISRDKLGGENDYSKPSRSNC